MSSRQVWQPLPGFVDFSVDPYVFDVDDYLDKVVPDKEMLKYPETRRELTKSNPLLFAMLYLPHHLKGADDEMHFSYFHLSAYRWASGVWHQRPGLDDARDAFLCPRGAGKSTTLFTTLLLWAACHGHAKFVAGYSDSESTVKLHFNTFRDELTSNSLIKADYPGMSLGRHVWETQVEGEDDEGNKVVNNAMNLKTYGGFIFMVRSISSNSLGVKVGHRRPDFILLDDIERPAGDYSVKQADKRLMSLTGGILPQSQPLGARVVLVGTNLMQGSIIDGMIKIAQGLDGPEWIKGQNFKCHWFRPFIRRKDGSKQSFWPGVWSTEFLLDKEENDPDFGVNFDNQPMAKGGAFWEDKDFIYGAIPTEKVSFGLLCVDPAVSSSRTSDFTAMAIVLYSRELRRYEVAYSNQFKMRPEQLRAKVEQLISSHPEVTTLYVETNQGGDTWGEIFKGIPIKYLTVKQSKSKEMRASLALNVYQTIMQDGLPRVLHRAKFADLQAQMKSFPNSSNDDLVDSVTMAICSVEERVNSDNARRGRSGPVLAARNRRR